MFSMRTIPLLLLVTSLLIGVALWIDVAPVRACAYVSSRTPRSSVHVYSAWYYVTVCIGVSDPDACIERADEDSPRTADFR